MCANTQAAAFADNVGEYTFSHSGDIEGKLTDVRDALKLVPVYLDQFQTEAEKMIEKQLARDQLQRISDELWPLDEDDKETAFLRKLGRDRDLHYLFEQAPTQENIRGTAWAGYQAITGWLDHRQPAKSDYHRAQQGPHRRHRDHPQEAGLRPGPGRLNQPRCAPTAGPSLHRPARPSRDA